MVTLARVAEIALALPGVEEADRRGQRTWRLADKTFAWERTFSKADIRRYGEEPVPGDPIVAIRVADLAEKEAVLAAGKAGFFTIPHFDGYAAILIELKQARVADVKEALVDGWLVFASPEAAQEVVGKRRNGQR
ncbi:MAG TPA: hypothetical protein VHV76_11125 [Mycobacteriales bacterium]|nr:hypothetical protein [Mycobacteriales bacterium]